MKTTTRINLINPNLLKVTFDVGKDSLSAYTELPLADQALRASAAVPALSALFALSAVKS